LLITAQQLLAKGYHVSTLKRAGAKGMPVDDRVETIVGGFENVASISNALTGVDAAVFTLPLVFDMDTAKNMTSNFIEAAKAQNIALIVFNSSFDLPTENTGLLALDLKVETKKLLDASGLNVITLMPDVYIDNLAAPWSIPLIKEQGILPYPVANGQKIPWISHVDLAKFVASAIEKPELASKTLPIGGNLMSCDEIASAIGNQIGQSVQFISITPDEFEKNLAAAFGEVPAREISNLYRYLASNMEQIRTKDFGSVRQELGVELQTVNEWVKSVNW